MKTCLCDTCAGVGNKLGMGGMMIKCKDCKGTGYIKDEEPVINVESKIKTNAENPEKKRKKSLPNIKKRK